MMIVIMSTIESLRNNKESLYSDSKLEEREIKEMIT